MDVSRRTMLKALLAAGVGATTGVGAYRVVYQRDELRLTEATLPVSRLPPALAGLRIALITDVHRSRWVSEADVLAAVALAMSKQPDLVVLGGDYVTLRDRKYIGPVAAALGGLSAPLGVFGVLGNHDDDHVIPELRAHRVQVLKDARTRLIVRNEPLELAGIDFWTRRPAELAAVIKNARGTVVLLAHDPRRLTEASALDVPLVLSGHTHGGQVVLPVVGAIAARKFPVVAGTARRGNTTMFVSRGLGPVYLPGRVNCPPEVAVLTLVTAEA